MQRFLVCLSAFVVPFLAVAPLLAESGESTRVTSRDQHACTGGGGYPYRQKAEYVIAELDLRPGDTVVDIGAGDGWWTEKMVKCVGDDGVVYASEVDQKKVDQMKEKFGDVPQAKPYLCPTDGTALDKDTCDLAFLSKSYHHLNKGSHVAYLRHLRDVVKPDGRLCIIERYPELGKSGSTHGWTLSRLTQQAEEAGWIPVRCELLTATYHYMAVFVQEDLFPPEPSRERSKPGADGQVSGTCAAQDSATGQREPAAAE